MYRIAQRLLGLLPCACVCLGLLLIPFATQVAAAQIDIHGPTGSTAFGTSVTVLPNGNIVVTDPNGPVSNIGAVYLYDPNGNLISTLTGSTQDDHVGSGGVAVVGNGNFVAISPLCKIGAATHAGAVTWMSGSTGLGANAQVSSSNSLVGSTSEDQVGVYGVGVLSNGNYVVRSIFWNNGAGASNSAVGAATWGDGNTGISGPVSTSNSLIGSSGTDLVGSNFIALSNGNYVVGSDSWHNGASNAGAGAATWGNGLGGTTGPVSTSNSLTGTRAGDFVGRNIIALVGNGNYVVNTPTWSNPFQNFGAVTWGNGAGGTSGAVSAGNSLVGDVSNDAVGGAGVIALTNGNYVVASPHWSNNNQNAQFGAATWGNGLGGTIGSLSSSNSTIGTSVGDNVGASGATALSNGNYVIVSPYWSNVGAVTWGNGLGGTHGPVLPGNSLYGTTPGDSLGLNGVTALSNGNYVVASMYWNNGTASNPVGAATWGNGASGTTGPVTTSNSLFGTTAGDNIGSGSVIALSNGNYVVCSPNWNNAFGAATWGNGSGGSAGPVLFSNSLTGSTGGDSVGSLGAAALGNGNYVVASPFWNNNLGTSHFGAITWANGNGAISGPVSAANSLIGTIINDQVGSNPGATALNDGNYVARTSIWNNGGLAQAGAVTLASSRFRLKGTIQSWNSVRGGVANGGSAMIAAVSPIHSYDATRHRLAVGRPAENIVSLFTMDQIFASDFDP